MPFGYQNEKGKNIGSPLMAFFEVEATDKATLPEGLKADRAWIIFRDEIWETSVGEESDQAKRLRAVARGGPRWGPGVKVDVVLRLLDRIGNKYLLRASKQEISEVD
jgi:hypothetical protein